MTNAPTVPAWGPTFLRLYALPTRPSIDDVLERWPVDGERPSHGEVLQFLERLENIAVKSSLASLTFYCRRTSDEIKDLQVVDGNAAFWRRYFPAAGWASARSKSG